MSKSNELDTIERHPTVVDPKAFEAAFDAYLQMQGAIDRRMPDQIQTIGDKQFRKKGYWRAVAKGFGISLRFEREDYFERGAEGDRVHEWGFRVVYTAFDPNGVFATGDGSCTSSEKDRGRMEATDHNVRSHAHTRAQNRAISNLVGFGEVSADELPQQGESKPPQTRSQGTAKGSNSAWDGTQEVFFGKHKGTPWMDVPGGYLEWVVENMQDPAKKQASMEIGRRAREEAAHDGPVEGEVVDDEPNLPHTEGPPPDDPRFQTP